MHVRNQRVVLINCCQSTNKSSPVSVIIKRLRARWHRSCGYSSIKDAVAHYRWSFRYFVNFWLITTCTVLLCLGALWQKSSYVSIGGRFFFSSCCYREQQQSYAPLAVRTWTFYAGWPLWPPTFSAVWLAFICLPYWLFRVKLTGSRDRISNS